MHLISPAWGPLDSAQALQALNDANPDFTVIGICSAECSSSYSNGTVAAALVSLLSGRRSSDAATAKAALGSGESGSKQLHGLQIHIHPHDRVILLDAGNILSPDILSALLAPERPQPAVGSAAAAAVRAAASQAGSSSSIPVEGVGALLQLQMMVFLFAVCNAVVICSPDYDLQLLQLLETVSLIGASIPDITLPAAVLQKQQSMPRGRGSSSSSKAHRSGTQLKLQQQCLPCHLADLVLVRCCKKQQDMDHRCMLQFKHNLDACLRDTVWAKRQELLQEPPGSAAAAGGGAAAVKPVAVHDDHKQYSGLASSSAFNVWAVPAAAGTSDGGLDWVAGVSDKQQQRQQDTQQPSLQLQQLVSMLLQMPRTINAAGSNYSSSRRGTFSRAISERDWLLGAERVWEAVQNSSELLQYYGLAAVARYAGAGGWRQR